MLTLGDAELPHTNHRFGRRVGATVLVLLASLAMGLVAWSPAHAQEPLRILATGVFATTLEALAAPFEAASGHKLQISIANAGQVAARITAGAQVDLVMSSSASIKALARQGILSSPETPIGRMRLGVALPLGAAMPDLSSAEAFRGLLLSAAKVSYIDPNGGGTSGPFFEKMFASLGVADAVHAKAVLCKDGAQVVGTVASGDAAIGMTQASEIIGARGITFAGYLPDSLNLTTPYSASIPSRSKNAEAAAAFLAFVAGPVGSEQLRRAGWLIDR